MASPSTKTGPKALAGLLTAGWITEGENASLTVAVSPLAVGGSGALRITVEDAHGKVSETEVPVELGVDESDFLELSSDWADRVSE